MWASLILATFIAITIVIAQSILIGAFKKPDKEEDKEEKSKNFLHFLYRRKIRRPYVAAKRYIAAMYAVNRGTWWAAIFVGAAAGLINWLSSLTPMIAILGLIAMIGYFVALGYWWLCAGAEWKELIPFILLAIAGVFPTGMAASVVASKIDGGMLDSFIEWIPIILLVGIIVFLVAHLWYHRETESFSKEKGGR